MNWSICNDTSSPTKRHNPTSTLCNKLMTNLNSFFQWKLQGFFKQKLPNPNPNALKHLERRLTFKMHRQQQCGSGLSMSTSNLKGKSQKVVVRILMRRWQLLVCRTVVLWLWSLIMYLWWGVAVREKLGKSPGICAFWGLDSYPRSWWRNMEW